LNATVVSPLADPQPGGLVEGTSNPPGASPITRNIVQPNNIDKRSGGSSVTSPETRRDGLSGIGDSSKGINSCRGTFNKATRMDDEPLPDGLETVAAASMADSSSRRLPGLVRYWWPPAEFSALVGLLLAVALAGMSQALLCKPIAVHYSHSR
jgi:hypothetical protein